MTARLTALESWFLLLHLINGWQHSHLSLSVALDVSPKVSSPFLSRPLIDYLDESSMTLELAPRPIRPRCALYKDRSSSREDGELT